MAEVPAALVDVIVTATADETASTRAQSLHARAVVARTDAAPMLMGTASVRAHPSRAERATSSTSVTAIRRTANVKVIDPGAVADGRGPANTRRETSTTGHWRLGWACIDFLRFSTATTMLSISLLLFTTKTAIQDVFSIADDARRTD